MNDSAGDLRNHFVYKYTPHVHRDRRKKRETSDAIHVDTRVKWHAAQVIIDFLVNLIESFSYRFLESALSAIF